MPMEKKDNEKKQILLRLAPSLWKDLAAWAEDDYRSINGQIEFLLSECVRKRKSRAQKEAVMQEKFLSGEITPEEYHTWLKKQEAFGKIGFCQKLLILNSFPPKKPQKFRGLSWMVPPFTRGS